MNTTELKMRLYLITPFKYGLWRVIITKGSRKLEAFTTNSQAIDRLAERDYGIRDREKTAGTGYTYKQALKALYDEVKIKNQ